MVRAGGGHHHALRHGVQDADHGYRILFIAVIGRERDAVTHLQVPGPGDPAANIGSLIRQGQELHIRVHKPYLVPGDGVDFQTVTLIADLNRPLGAPVPFQGFCQGISFFIGYGFRVQIHPVAVMNGLLIEGIQEGVHGILHAHAAYQQDHTAHHAEQSHEAPGLVAEAVSQIPFCAEGQGFEALAFLYSQMAHLLRHIGPQSVRRGAFQHFSHGKIPDHGQEDIDQHNHNPGKGRRIQGPGGQINIGGHGAIRAQDKPAQAVSDTDSQRRTHQADHQGVGGIVPQDPPVLEPQRLQGTNLGFFAGGNPVHGGHHGQNRNGQEQHRQNGAHGDAFLHLSPGP